MLFWTRADVMMEVVNHDGRAVGREADAELEEQRLGRGCGWGPTGEGEQDVAVLVDEVEEELGG